MSESRSESRSDSAGVSRAEMLAEAYKRGILPDDMKSAYEEALRRGLVEPAAERTDVLAEVGAVGSGINRGVAMAAGLPVDLVNAGLNLFGAGTAEPVGGSASIRRGLDALGGQTDVQAQTRLGRLASRAGEEVGAALVPMAGALSIPARAAAGPVASTLRNAVAGTSGGDRAAQLAMSAGAGLGAGVAQEAGPGSAPAMVATLGAGAGAYAGQRAGAAYAPGVLGRLLGGAAGFAAGGYAGSQVPENAQVAEFAGGLLGGAATVPALAVGGMARDLVAPLHSREARQGAAGYTLNQFVSDPDSVVGAPSEIVPGSPLTTAQAAQDPGLASLERTLRSQKVPGPLFAQRDADRALAQRNAMQGLAPENGGAEDVAANVRDAYGRLVSTTGDMVNRAGARVEQRLGAVGPGLDPVTAGRTVRDELGGARDVAKTAESNLWQRLQDNEDLALEVGAAPANARKMLDEISPSAKPPSGDAAGVLDAAANLGGVVRWRELQDLRSWAAQTSSDLAASGDAVNKRRVDAVLRGLDADIARAVGPDDAPAGGGGASPGGPQTGGGAGPAGGRNFEQMAAGSPGPQNVGAVFTPDGMKIETQWRLVDLAGPDAPIVSHTPDFRENPRYPQALQPRNRDRAASEAQVVEIAGKLNPERLGAGGVGDGAPIIGPDRVTESGNGRLLAIDRAYSNGGRRPAEYRAWIEAQGFRTDGMERPALVRVRTNDLPDADRVRFTEAANSGPGLKLSPVEQAAVDARRVDDATLSLYRGGALDAPDNVDFARAFVRQAAPGDAGTLSTADGRLSLEGARRMQGAMLAKTYGDAPIVQTLLETGDDDIRALGRALADTAPQMAQLRAAISRGDVPAAFDPVATLTDAARVVQRARRDGVPIGAVLAQSDAFNPTNPHAAAFLGAAYGDGFRRVSYGRATEALRTYADEAMRQTGGGDMFGPGPAPGDVWAAAQRRARGIGDDAQTAAPGAGGGGSGAAGGGGPVPPAGAGGSGGGAGVVDDGLTPNFGPEDAAQYRAARAATAERKGTFDRGAVGQALAKGGYNARDGVYAMPVEQVAGRFFNSGRASATDMAEFLQAAESRPAAIEALRDYAIGDLRRAAVDDAGKVDPKRWAGWIAKHGQALSAFPEVRRDLSNVSAAQRSLDRLTARRDEAVKGFEKSAAGEFLRKDPEQAFASVIKSGNRTQGLTQLVRMAKGDPDKMEQLRRAAVNQMIRTIENKGAVDALSNNVLSPAKTKEFMAANGKALQKSGLLSPGQIAVLNRVEEDMNRAVYAQTVGKAVGSNTYQNLATGAVLGQISMGMAKPNGLLANTIGRAGNWMYRVADKEVQALVAEAMLDPALARELMARATPERVNWLGDMLKRRALATGLITATTSDGEQ